MRVIGDRVLVALPPEPDELTTVSGLVLVKDPDRHITPSQGIVVQVGEKSRTVDLCDALGVIVDCTGQTPQSMALAIYESIAALLPPPFDVAVGDCVLFSPASGEELEDDGIRYVILREAEIIGVVEPIVKNNEAA